MKVRLNRNWFGPDASRYRIGEHEFPDTWRKLLPKTAEIIEPVKEAKNVDRANVTLQSGS